MKYFSLTPNNSRGVASQACFRYVKRHVEKDLEYTNSSSLFLAFCICIQLRLEFLLGFAVILMKLEGYQNAARELKAMDMDHREEIPLNFLFRGPPGKSDGL